MLRRSRRSSALAVRSPVYLVATVAYSVGIDFKAWRKNREVPFRTISQLPWNMKTRLTSDSVKTCVIHHTNFKQFLWDGLEKFFKYFFSKLLLGQSLTSEWISTQIKLLQNYDAANFNVLDQHTDIRAFMLSRVYRITLQLIASRKIRLKNKRISHDMVFFKEKSIWFVIFATD